MRKHFPFIFIIIDFFHCVLDTFRDFLSEWGMTIFAFGVILFSLYLGYLRFYPFNPIRIDSLCVDKTEARVGDAICFKLVAEKLMDIPVNVNVDLANGEGIPIMDYTSYTPSGTFFNTRCFNIPMHIKTNFYRLRWKGVYHVNGLKDVNKDVFSKSIHITNDIEREGPQGERGKQGRQGVPGPRGFTGAKGFTGPKGGIVIFGK